MQTSLQCTVHVPRVYSMGEELCFHSACYRVPTKQMAAPSLSLLHVQLSNWEDSEGYCTLRSVYFSISTVHRNILSSYCRKQCSKLPSDLLFYFFLKLIFLKSFSFLGEKKRQIHPKPQDTQLPGEAAPVKCLSPFMTFA